MKKIRTYIVRRVVEELFERHVTSKAEAIEQTNAGYSEPYSTKVLSEKVALSKARRSIEKESEGK